MLRLGLMALGALLLLSYGERREEESETRAGRAQEKASGIPGFLDVMFRRASGRYELQL
jgi:hypothetical protein